MIASAASRRFETTLRLIDVVGLYLNPPDKALVLCVDEKSQIQALDRTQPGLPLKPGRCGSMTHDYKRRGTTTLFAALNMIDGKVIGDCMPLDRHQEFIRFLKRIDQETPKEFELHLIVDNYATHKHPGVERWLHRNPRFHLHSTPTSSSWLNLVERWFRNLTQQRLRRGCDQRLHPQPQPESASLRLECLRSPNVKKRWTHYTSKKRSKELPCLLMCPSRCLPALESSQGMSPT